MAKNCGKCGAQNIDEALFCLNCGQQFTAVPREGAAQRAADHPSVAESYLRRMREAEAADRNPVRQENTGRTAAAQSEREAEAPFRSGAQDWPAMSPAAARQKKPRSKAAILIPAVLAVLAAIIVTVTLLIANSSKTIHLEEYISDIRFDGYSGSGSVYFDFDRYAVEEQLYANGGIDESDFSFSNIADYGSSCYDILSAIDTEVENNGHFSNGDDIVITVTYAGVPKSKLFKSKILGGSVTIKNYREFPGPTYIDLMSEEYLKVTFTGTNGNGKCIVESINSDDFRIDSVWSNQELVFPPYRTDPSTELSNGDVVTVSMEIDPESSIYQAMTKKGYRFDLTGSRQYTVSGLVEYVSADALTEDVLETAKNLVNEQEDKSGCRYKIEEILYKEARYINSEEGYQGFFTMEPRCFNRLILVVKRLTESDSLPENNPDEKLDDPDAAGTILLYCFSNMCRTEEGVVQPQAGWNNTETELNYIYYSTTLNTHENFLRGNVSLDPEEWNVTFFDQ